MGEPGFWTIAIMAVTALVLIGWDIYVAFFNRTPNEKDTISGILLGWSKRVWVLPYAFGVLGGHLFVPRTGEPFFGHVGSTGLLLVVGLAVGIVGLFSRRTDRPWPIQSPFLLVLGAVMGHLFWSQ